MLEKCLIVFNGNDNTLIIGDNLRLKNIEFVMNDDENSIEIGSSNSFGRNVCIIVEEGTSVTIGVGCQIGSGVSIRTSDGHSIIDMTNKRRINLAKNVVIENCVWIGENVKILKGSHVESNCVIGAGSIVAGKKLNGNSIYVGAPVKQIRENIDWISERIKN